MTSPLRGSMTRLRLMTKGAEVISSSMARSAEVISQACH